MFAFMMAHMWRQKQSNRISAGERSYISSLLRKFGKLDKNIYINKPVEKAYCYRVMPGFCFPFNQDVHRNRVPFTLVAKNNLTLL
jgi:hypothetical protein